MAKHKDYKSRAAYQKLALDLNTAEDTLKTKMAENSNHFDVEIVGEAAAVQKLVAKDLEGEGEPLNPDMLRYLARQCKQILVYRKYDKKYSSLDKESADVEEDLEMSGENEMGFFSDQEEESTSVSTQQ